MSGASHPASSRSFVRAAGSLLLWLLTAVLPAVASAPSSNAAEVAARIGVDAGKYLAAAPASLVAYVWLCSVMAPLFTIFIVPWFPSGNGSVKNAALVALRPCSLLTAQIVLGAFIVAAVVGPRGTPHAWTWFMSMILPLVATGLTAVGLCYLVLELASTKVRYVLGSLGLLLCVGAWGAVERSGRVFVGSPAGIENVAFSGHWHRVVIGITLSLVWVFGGCALAVKLRRVRNRNRESSANSVDSVHCPG